MTLVMEERKIDELKSKLNINKFIKYFGNRYGI